MGQLEEEMPEIRQKLPLQREQLQDLEEFLKRTIVTVNLHSALINNKVPA